ncbi:MAG: hypothetical protein JSS29_01755 [Proteobacteria bacterium]|nr:hypothetical protein [Pseudomonadota bacterium]
MGVSADPIAEPVKTLAKQATPRDPPPGMTSFTAPGSPSFTDTARLIPAIALDHLPSQALLYLSTARLRL